MTRTVLDELVFQTALDRSLLIEERLRVLIQPKPRWMPARVWERVLRRVLILEESRR